MKLKNILGLNSDYQLKKAVEKYIRSCCLLGWDRYLYFL